MQQSLKEIQPETKFRRKIFDEKYLIVPPIKGKPPYENFQLDAIRKGIKQNRLALFLQMGTGKTYIVTSLLNQLYAENEIDKIVIVSPSEGVYNWRRELLHFSNFLTKDNILISQANSNRNPFEQDLSNVKVIIMTYRHYLTLSAVSYTHLTLPTN